MSTLILAAFLAGLVGTPHCAGMCGPFAVASQQPVLWSLGRLVIYGILGAAAGTVGLGLASWLGWPSVVVGGVLLVWFAARMAGIGPAFKIPFRLPFRLPKSSFLLGMVTGLLPCGLTWAALSYAPLVNLPGFQSEGLTPFPSLKPRKVHERSIFDACF